MKTPLSLFLLLLFAASTAWADAHLTTAPDGAKAYFIAPADGATVPQTFIVQFGLSGMGVAPAGTQKANTGHHHLLIDADSLPDLSNPLPSNDQVKHFGGGQTEASITLAPGKHTLQLVVGNFAHQPHDKPVMSEKITITVK